MRRLASPWPIEGPALVWWILRDADGIAWYHATLPELVAHVAARDDGRPNPGRPFRDSYPYGYSLRERPSPSVMSRIPPR